MSMTNSASFIEHSYAASDNEVTSLPSSTTASDSGASEDEELSDAEREWRESLQQLELLLTMVLVPYVGKYIGRKCAYWGTYCLHATYGRVGELDRGLDWDNANAMRRLGKVHGVEIPRLHYRHFPQTIQRRRCDRSGGGVITPSYHLLRIRTLHMGLALRRAG
jgi:hypothetical protein